MHTKTLCIVDPRDGHTYQLTYTDHATDLVRCATGKDYAFGEIFVKIIYYGDALPEKQRMVRENAISEATLMEKINRCTKYAPMLYSHWENKAQKYYVLVMQKMPGQTLRQWEDRHSVKAGDKKAIWLRNLILRNLILILCDIRRNFPDFGHKDLKPENVMIWRDEKNHWQVGLIDFGTAALNHSVGVGTRGYSAPEQNTLQGNKISTGFQKDIFSLAMIWHEMLSGTKASESYEQFHQSRANTDWESRLHLPDFVEQDSNYTILADLFREMTALDPQKRPAPDRAIRMLDRVQNRRRI